MDRKPLLGGRFGFFFFFLFGGGGKGGRVRGGCRGVGFLLKLEGGGGGFRGGVVGGGRAPGECLWGGGGAKFFFSGPKCPPRLFPKLKPLSPWKPAAKKGRPKPIKLKPWFWFFTQREGKGYFALCTKNITAIRADSGAAIRIVQF